MSSVNGIAMETFPNYAVDIEKHWKFKETQRKRFKFQSPQMSFRKCLVDWLKSVSEKERVSYRTFHLAMYILDMFMDTHTITTDRLGFVALVSLMLSAKFEELDSKIPKISDLNKYDGYRYSSKDFNKVEVMVIKNIDFDLTQPTVAHFAEYYLMVAVVPLDLSIAKGSFPHLKEKAHNILRKFLDICLNEVKFWKFLPSEVAAGCVWATRRHMRLSPAWTSILAEVTGYPEDSIVPCVRLISQIVRKENADRIGCGCVHSPDQRSAEEDGASWRQTHPSPDLGYISDSHY